MSRRILLLCTRRPPHTAARTYIDITADLGDELAVDKRLRRWGDV